MIEMVEADGMIVAADALPLLKESGLVTFDDFMNFDGGTRICHKRGRSVFRFESGGRAFYLKRNRLHRVEFWKALSRFRWPSLGARTEWENILAVQAAGIPTVTPIAMGERFSYGIETASFTLTEEIYGAEPLDVVWRRDFAAPRSPERVREKRTLVEKLALLTRRLHGCGMYHQDFYLNHFFLGPDGALHLLDLQRVGRRRQVPEHYRIKDLGQLNYSADYYGGVSRRDKLLFLHAYLGRDGLSDLDKVLLRRVAAKTARIASHDVKLRQRRRRRGELP